MDENRELEAVKQERKQVARTRIFYTLVALCAALLIYLVIEILILVS